jgi:hypothetical protein
MTFPPQRTLTAFTAALLGMVVLTGHQSFSAP